MGSYKLRCVFYDRAIRTPKRSQSYCPEPWCIKSLGVLKDTLRAKAGRRIKIEKEEVCWAYREFPIRGM